MSDVLKFKVSSLSDTFTGNGSTSFTLSYPAASITSVYVGDTPTNAYSFTKGSNVINFTSAPSGTIIVNYDGWAGLPTIKGDEGKTAYQSAVSGGYVGTETQFNSDLAAVKNKQDKINVTNGLVKMVNGVPTAAVEGTDYIKTVGTVAKATEAGTLTGLTATVAELNFVDGVTSNVQTQLNGKAASTHPHTANNINAGTLNGAVKANASAVAGLTTAQVRNISAGTTDYTAGVTALATGDIYIYYEA